MDIRPPWAEALGITDEQLQTWKSQGAPTHGLLEWCLDREYVHEVDYLNWAREFYKIAVLRVGFFEKEVPLKLWQQHKNPTWKASLFPIHEWDGVLYVGCLEPPVEKPAGKNIQYVLAPYSLQKIWFEAVQEPAQPAPVEEEPTIEEDPVPAQAVTKASGLPMAPQPGQRKEDTRTGLSFDSLSEALSAPDNKGTYVTQSEVIHDLEAIKEASEGPMGLNLDLDIPSAAPSQTEEFKLNLALERPLTDGNPSTEPAPIPEAPIGLSLDLDTKTSLSQVSKQTEPIGLAKPEPPASGTPIGGQASPIPIVPPKTTLPPSESQPKPMAPGPSVPPPSTASLRPPPPPGVKVGAKASVAPPPPPTKQVLLPAVSSTFDKMRSHFLQCMVLTYKDEKLKPWQWDQNWRTPGTVAEINSKDASIFRIVIDSKQPYHGFISPNDVNGAFFKDWNNGVYPDHVTILPLLHQGNLIGMLMGVAIKDKSSQIQLSTYQALADELALQLKEVPAQAAA